MDALSVLIGQNCVPWWGRDVTITPLVEDSKRNVGYVIKINGWDHFAVVSKAYNGGVFRIVTPSDLSNWRGEDNPSYKYNGIIEYENLDKTPNMQNFWDETIKLLQTHVEGEENLYGSGEYS
jgi:hypothetical protein